MRIPAIGLSILLCAACAAQPQRPTDASAASRPATSPAAASPATASPAKASPAILSAGCNWQSLVLPADRTAVEADIDTALARIPSSAGMPDYLGDDLKEASLGGIVLAHALLQRARTPLALGDVTGAWQVRSIQASGDSVYDYPFFRSRIDAVPCGYRFVKTTGSQRRTGKLLPMAGDTRALAFLGTATVNDNPTGDYSAQNPPLGTANGSEGDRPVNSAGRLLRIGRDELLMLLDMDERGFEIYHLKR